MSDDRTISVMPADLSVAIGFPCGQSVPYQTALSLAKTIKTCTKRRIEVEMCAVSGASVVTLARSRVLDAFLQTTCSRLFWIDSDMQWEPDNFLRLLVLSTKYDVVCGTYAQKTDAQGICLLHQDLLTFDVNSHGLVRFQGTGLGFTVLRREIAQHISDTKPKFYDPVYNRAIADVFRIDSVDRGHEVPDFRGEDIAFFTDLIGLGYEVWLDPTIVLGHVGAKVYQRSPLEALRLEDKYKELAEVE